MMTRAEVMTTLRRDNPQARQDDIAMYADSFMEYQAAVANITQCGTICTNEKTGMPFENPFLKVKASAMNEFRKIVRLKNVGALWQ